MPVSRRTFLKSASGAAVVALNGNLLAQATSPTAGIAYTGEHVRQVIDGFGFSEAFQQAGVLRVLSDADQKSLLNLMFSAGGGMGYSILRNQIGDSAKPQPNTGDIQAIEPAKGEFIFTGDENQIWLMNEAKARGCTRFLSSCWSPPAWMKTNGKVHDGALKKECYQDFADMLATYVAEYKKRFNLDIYAISPTNEPNFVPTLDYASCKWTAEELSKFLRENLFPALKAKGVAPEVVIDEHEHWSDEYINVILDDPGNSKAIHIVAAHAYAPDSGPYVSISARTGTFAKALGQGKRVWETEVSVGTGPQILNMNDGVYWARVIHSHMVENNVSAWLYWWGGSNSNSRSSLIWIDIPNKKYQLSKRFFTIGHFSRFIRPGYHRVDATPTPAPNTYFSAYLSPDSKRLVCVAINDDSVERPLSIQPGGFPATSCIAVRTSNTETHAKLPPIQLVNGAASVVTAPLSVTTYIFTA